MKHAPEKVYIKVNGEYIEITNKEHEARKSADKEYAKRWFVPLQGCLMETDEAFYVSFYKDYERQRYIRKVERAKRILSIEAFDSEDDNGIDFLVDDSEDVCESVIQKIMLEKLVSVLPLLAADERELIEALFYQGFSEREYAKEKGVYQFAIHKKKQRILEKLKKFLEN